MVIFLVAAIALTLVIAFRGLVVMWLWNWVMPTIFALPELSFMHAVGLSLLASFLIGFNSPSTTSKKVEK